VISDEIRESVSRALDRAGLPEPERPFEVVPPKQREHGDWQTNVALLLAKQVG
jgi:arginyl-tRNA synthetase